MKTSRIIAGILITGALSLGTAPAFAASDPTSFVNDNDVTTSGSGSSTSIRVADGSSSLAYTGADEEALTDLLMVGAGALTLGMLAVGATSPAARRARRRTMAHFRR